MAARKARVTTISWKLTLIYAGIFSLVLIMLNAATLVGVRYYLLRQATGQVVNIGQMILDRIEKSNKTMEDLADDALILEIPSNDNIYVKIIDQRGNVLNETPKFNLKIPEKIPTSGEHLIYLGRHLLYKNRPISLNGHVYAYLQVVKNLSNEGKFLRALFGFMIIADLTGVVISVLSGWFLGKNILKPIANLTKTAQSISAHGDLGRRIEIDGPHDELTNLAMTFNQMIERLQHAFEQQNQFVSDASHELRTPIQVIQGYANLLDRWGKEDKEILQESIEAIKNETTNMSALVERLLFLARGDQGLAQLEPERFPVDRLIHEIFEETRILGPTHQVAIGQNDSGNITADRKLIKQMIRAVVDNSLKFTPPGGGITLSAIDDEEAMIIEVTDTGIGIPDEDIPRIFDRFYQVDKVRMKTQSGTGLGLAIVKWVADAHHGAVSVESKEGRGTTVRMKIPKHLLNHAGENLDRQGKREILMKF